MDTTLKYRTMGSLPIGTQRYTEYIPRPPEPPQTKAKPDAAAPTNQQPAEGRRPPPPPPPPKPKVKPIAPEAAAPPHKMKMPPYDPCKAIIETSPYYVYFKIVTESDAAEQEDIREVLHKLVVVDKDMPRTAKYRNFRSYVQ